MATSMVGKVRRARKVDPNGNIYYDRTVSDVVFDPIRGTSVKHDIDELRKAMATCLKFVAANPKGMDGKSAYEIAQDAGFVGTEEEWLQSLHGVAENGLNAYEVAVVEGLFTGTVEQWYMSLHGERGDKGDSAYKVCVNNGYEGTEAEWVAQLINDEEPITRQDVRDMYQAYLDAAEEPPVIEEGEDGGEENV